MFKWSSHLLTTEIADVNGGLFSSSHNQDDMELFRSVDNRHFDQPRKLIETSKNHDRNYRMVGRPKVHLTLTDKKCAHAKSQREYYKRKKQEKHHRTQFTGEQEWYTPIVYLDAVKEVLGVIDLDPASSLEAQKNVQSSRYYTAQDNAMIRAWAGRVFLNPPYNQPLIEYFVVRLVEEVQAGHVSEAILLTHNYTDTKWFHCAESAASCICFTRGRIKFESADGKLAAPTQGQAFFYFGSNQERFKEVFAKFGMVR